MKHTKYWAMRVGTKIELEHTKNKNFAAKIASDHLKEFGPQYYVGLIKLEKQLAKRKQK